VIRKRGTGLQVQVYAGRDPLTGRKRWVSRQVPGQTKASMREPSRSRPAPRGDRRRPPQGLTLAHHGRAAGALAGVATDGAADRPYHRLQLPCGHGPLHPPGPRQAPGPPVGRRHPGCLLRPPADPWRQDGRPLAASSVRQIHAILSGALTRAVVWGWINHNRPGSPPHPRATRPTPSRRRWRTPPACSAPPPPRIPSWGCFCVWPWCSAPAGVSCARCAGRRSTWTRARS
jgi:integrase